MLRNMMLLSSSLQTQSWNVLCEIFITFVLSSSLFRCAKSSKYQYASYRNINSVHIFSLILQKHTHKNLAFHNLCASNINLKRQS